MPEQCLHASGQLTTVRQLTSCTGRRDTQKSLKCPWSVCARAAFERWAARNITLREQPVFDAEVAGERAFMIRDLDRDEEEVIVHLRFILASHNDRPFYPWLLQTNTSLYLWDIHVFEIMHGYILILISSGSERFWQIHSCCTVAECLCHSSSTTLIRGNLELMQPQKTGLTRLLSHSSRDVSVSDPQNCSRSTCSRASIKI